MNRKPEQLPLALRPGEQQRFENFVSGDNKLSIDALRNWQANEPSGHLHIEGPAGSGKSHLLQAAMHTAQESGLGTAYLALNDLPAPLDILTDGWEALDLCILDQLDALVDDHELQIALFTLYNKLYDNNVKLLTASQPGLLAALSLPDLRSRLQWGTTLSVKALNDDALQAAWRHRAQARGLSIAPAALDYLLKRERRELPALLQRLERLDEAAFAEQRGQLTIPFLRRVLYQQ